MTETSLMHDLDAIRKVLHQLRGEGFTVAIDDFGTGYSSLTHLKHFPIDTLKIDISFIADLETDPGDAAITEAIIGLARGLGLKVVAEGVGTRAQLDFLDVARLPLLPGLLGQQAAAGEGIRRVRDEARRSRQMRVADADRVRRDKRLRPAFRFQRVEPRLQRLRHLRPFRFEHQHVRESRAGSSPSTL